MTRNNYLTQNIQGFYHTDFGGVELPNNPNYLYKLKNGPHHNWPDFRIQEAQQQLLAVLLNDLPDVLSQTNKNSLTVCVVPRAKTDTTYRPNRKGIFSFYKQNGTGSLSIDKDRFIKSISFITSSLSISIIYYLVVNYSSKVFDV